ncbi:MAG: DUF3352 domain-containing protein, partial [bacterium]
TANLPEMEEDAMFEVSCVTRGWRLNCLTTLFVLLALLAVNAFATRVNAADKPLTAVLPLTSPGFISVDTQYLWNSSAEIRKSEVVDETINDFNLATGLSLNDDIMSWTGQIAIASLDYDEYYHFPESPTESLILIQIRDQAVYAAKFPTVQSKLEKMSGKEWKTVEYKGISMREMAEKQYNYRGNEPDKYDKFQVATVDGWVVFSQGEAPMQNLIDVSKGEVPPLEQHPLFAKVVKDLPKGNVAQFCLNGDGILQSLKKHNEVLATRFSATDYDKTLLLGTISNDENGLATDVVACSSSLKIQEELKQLRADTGVVTGKSLPHLSEGTFAVGLISNPDKYVAYVEKRILESLTDAREKDAVGEQFADLADPRSILKRITGEMAVNATWDDEKGFGAALAGETKSSTNATMAYNALRAFAEDDKDKIVEENGMVKLLDGEEFNNKYFKFLLSFTTRKEWFVLGTHPDLIAQKPAIQTVQLPAEVKDGNSIVFFGNFDLLPSFLKKLKANKEWGAEMYQKIYDATPVKPGKWYITFNIDPDGKAERARISFPSDWPVTVGTTAISNFTKSQVSSKKQDEMNKVGRIAYSILSYAREHDDTLPIMESPSDLKKIYKNRYSAYDLVNLKGEPYLPNPSLSLKGLGTIEGDPAKIIIVYDETAWPDGSHTVAYLNGQTELIPADKWAAAKKVSGIP